LHLSTVLDDLSRYIVASKLYITISAADVTATLEVALQAFELDHAEPDRQPRLLSGNDPSYIAGDLSDGLDEQVGLTTAMRVKLRFSVSHTYACSAVSDVTTS
jgi:transposase InsO family protein